MTAPAAALAAGGPPPGAIEPALALALADGLVELTQLLSDLAFDLAGDAGTLRRHMHSLQSVDRITQAQLAIADVLRSSEPADRRLAAITLESLGAELTAKLHAHRRSMSEDFRTAPDNA